MDFDKSRPSKFTVDTEFNSVCSVLGWMESSLISKGDRYKFRLLQCFNDARRILRNGDAYEEFEWPSFTEMDIISSQRGNMHYTPTKRNWKPIYHEKTRGLACGAAFGAVREDYLVEMRGYKKHAVPSYASTRLLSLTHDLTTELMLARGRAASVMQPKIKRYVDGMLFIFEMPELRELIKLIASALLNYGKARKIVGRYYDPESPTQDLQSIVLPAAGLNLTWQLAVKPLIADIQGIQLMLREIGARYKALDRVKETTHHYSERLYSVDERVRQNTTWLNCISVGKMCTVDFHAESALIIDGRGVSFNTFAVESSGLSISWDTLYNAIPFSFLVDYVLTIGKSLELLNQARILPHVTLDYLETTKMNTSDGYHFDSRLYENFYVIPAGHKLNQNLMYNGWEKTVYNRIPTWPYHGLVVPRLRRLNTRQALIALCLVLAWS